ncbi:helix-turn-helix domain-containing protein [Sphingomonas sp. PWP1-2]|uniref:helix-turn-helix domain-containing protein n=1 Tax=Sphingomonas sp. PWP1-2 TaxID=2804558 RepID=UPI003CFA4731
MTFDPDFGKTGYARDLLRLRFRRLRLSQKAFAERFGLSHSSIRDQEQARFSPSAAFRVLMVAIELDPVLVERAARIAATRAPGGYDPDDA